MTRTTSVKLEKWPAIARLVTAARTKKPNARTQALELPDGRRAWLKVAESAQSNAWHHLQSFFARCCDNPLLLPSVATNGVQSLHGEAKRIRKLASCGFPVPAIVAEGMDWLVLEDSGLPSTSVLRDAKIPYQQRLTQLLEISSLLAKMHTCGCWHGRPALKDILCDDQIITLCDFEEDVALHLSPVQCQVRDVLIYGHSLYRVFCRFDIEMAELGLNRYWELAPSRVKNTLLEKISAMDVLLNFDVFLSKYLGGDARAAFLSLRHFNRLQRTKVV
jgi:tRNA A-37 threonylcarbamoyl transferase component Bud32